MSQDIIWHYYKVSKDHSRRIMKYIVEMSASNIEYDRLLSLYKNYRKNGYNRTWSIYYAVTDLLFDKILESEKIISQNPRIWQFTYGKFSYRLIIQEEDIGGFLLKIMGKDDEGNEYEAMEDYIEEGAVTAKEEGIKSLIEVMITEAIVNTEY